MSIATGQIITWSDFSSKCLSSIKSLCCNIDSYKSVPARLQSGQGQAVVRQWTTTVSGGGTAQTFTWYANPSSNLISLVSTATLESEWTTFLTSAGINTRSNKIIQANDLLLAIGLYKQFLSCHCKPVYSRRQIYNTVEAQSNFNGIKYITGTYTPKYVLTPIEKDNIPETTDANIRTIVRQNVIHDGSGWGLLSFEENPAVYRCYLS